MKREMLKLIKINSLQIENVKRVKAVELEPTKSGLTVIGGNNNQGKTSVLDSIAYALGGEKYKLAKRKESMANPYLKVELSNGVVVERKGKNSTLKITDTTGVKAGQSLLNEFISQFALDLPKFLNSNSKEKAELLLQIIGVGDKLGQLEIEEQKVFSSRYEIGRMADRKKKAAEEMIGYEDAPNELISASELLEQYQQVLAKNGENATKRNNLEAYERKATSERSDIEKLKEEIKAKTEMLHNMEKSYISLLSNIATAKQSVEQLQDESTEALQEKLNDIETINNKVKINQAKAKATADAEDLKAEYDALDNKLKTIKKDKIKLLENADLPLEGLNVQNGELTYKGFSWDNMSSAEQLVVATAIVRKLNENCGFVLMDKLEQFDSNTLKEFGKWLEKEQLQVIATRVTTNEDECSIIIEDGAIKDIVEPVKKTWKVGEF